VLSEKKILNETKNHNPPFKLNGRVVGPFKANPFIEGMVISPLNSVPKKDSLERRVIVDLNFPEGLAVNDGISKDLYLGEKVSVHYPTVGHIFNKREPMQE
jgi:hypothetical protein